MWCGLATISKLALLGNHDIDHGRMEFGRATVCKQALHCLAIMSCSLFTHYGNGSCDWQFEWRGPDFLFL